MTETEWFDIFRGNLQSIMDDRQMSRKELAQESGVSEPTLSRYLSGKVYVQRLPSIKTIVNLSEALDCDISDLCDFGEPID